MIPRVKLNPLLLQNTVGQIIKVKDTDQNMPVFITSLSTEDSSLSTLRSIPAVRQILLISFQKPSSLVPRYFTGNGGVCITLIFNAWPFYLGGTEDGMTLKMEQGITLIKHPKLGN